MILDKKGKLFGKVSVVDAALVLVVLLALAGAYARFSGVGKAVSASQAFTYAMRVDNIRDVSVAELKKSVGLTFGLNEKQQSEMGELLSVEEFPATGIIELNNGGAVRAPIPERFDVVLKFKVDGRINEKGFYTPQLKEICAGATYVVKSKYVTVYGMAMDVTPVNE
jgi:hypothetical protein